MKKILRRYIFYGISVALIYLLLPLFFKGENYKYDFIEYRFIFPATALLSGMIFSWKKGLDFTFPLLPPIIYILSAVIHSHYYHLYIYSFVYLILAMLGNFVGDMVYRTNPEKENISKTRKENFIQEHRITYTNLKVESISDLEEK